MPEQRDIAGAFWQYIVDAMPGGALNPEIPKDWPEKLKTILSFTPVVGDAISGYDAVQSARKGDYVDAGINALGMLPFVPGSIASVKNTMKKIITEKQLSDLVKTLNENEHFVRWSAGPRFDKKMDGSFDSVAGQRHGGLSAVPVNPEWADDPARLTRRIGEYGFLRIKNENISPYIYKGKRIGTDSDGYALIGNDVEPLAKIKASLLDDMSKKYKK